MSDRETYWPHSSPKGSGQQGSVVQWVAVIISVIALLASAYSAFRAYSAQNQANRNAKQANDIAQKNLALEKQLQAQSQAAAMRSSAEQVVFTTNPEQLSAGQGVQGVIIENGTHKKITDIHVIFTTYPESKILDYSHYASLGPCMQMTLSFPSSFSLPADWDAWLYFTDTDGNVWITDLLRYFSKGTQVPSGGKVVTDELNVSSSVWALCGQ